MASRITSIVMNAILVRLGGETAVSVYGVLMFVDGFIQPLLYGMCDSVQPAVGYNWGAQKYSRVRAIEKCCFIASAIISIAAVFVIAALPAEITRLFISDVSADVLAMSVSALRLFCLTYFIRWLSFATQSYMLAIEKPLPRVDFGFDRSDFPAHPDCGPLAAGADGDLVKPHRHLGFSRCFVDRDPVEIAS